MVEKLWIADAIWFGFFDSVLWRELVVSLQSNLNPRLTKISFFRERKKKQLKSKSFKLGCFGSKCVIAAMDILDTLELPLDALSALITPLLP